MPKAGGMVTKKRRGGNGSGVGGNGRSKSGAGGGLGDAGMRGPKDGAPFAGLRIGDLDNTEATAWQSPERDAALRTRGFVRIAQIIARGTTPDNKRNKPKEYKISLILERMCYEHACTRQEYENMRSFKVLLHRMAAEKAKRRTTSSDNAFRYALLDPSELASATTTTSFASASSSRASVLTPLSRVRAGASPVSHLLSHAVPISQGHHGFGSSFAAPMSSAALPSSLYTAPQLSLNNKLDSIFDSYSLDNGSSSSNNNNGSSGNNNNNSNDDDDDDMDFGGTFIKEEHLPEEMSMHFGSSKPPTPILPQLVQREQSTGSVASGHSMSKRYPMLDMLLNGGVAGMFNETDTSSASRSSMQQQQRTGPKGLASGTPVPLSRSSSANTPMLDLDFSPLPYAAATSGATLPPGAISSMLSPISPVPALSGVDMVYTSPGNEEPEKAARTSALANKARDAKCDIPKDAVKGAVDADPLASTPSSSASSTETARTEANASFSGSGTSITSKGQGGGLSGGQGEGNDEDDDDDDDDVQMALSEEKVGEGPAKRPQRSFRLDPASLWGEASDFAFDMPFGHQNPELEGQGPDGAELDFANASASLLATGTNTTKARSQSDSNLPVFNGGGAASSEDRDNIFRPLADGAFTPATAAPPRASRYGSRKRDGDRHHFRERTPRRRQSVAGTRFFSENDSRLQRIETAGNARSAWSPQRCFAVE